MATQDQIDELNRLFSEGRPQQSEGWQQRMPDSGSEGMLGVLIYLYRSDRTVTAGMISKAMHITTGRVSVLIKKMVSRDLITKDAGREDARVTEIRITDKGRQIIEDLQSQRRDQMNRLIDTVGMDRLREYIEISREVWSILTPLSVDL